MGYLLLAIIGYILNAIVYIVLLAVTNDFGHIFGDITRKFIGYLSILPFGTAISVILASIIKAIVLYIRAIRLYIS